MIGVSPLFTGPCSQTARVSKPPHNVMRARNRQLVFVEDVKRGRSVPIVSVECVGDKLNHTIAERTIATAQIITARRSICKGMTETVLAGS